MKTFFLGGFLNKEILACNSSDCLIACVSFTVGTICSNITTFQDLRYNIWWDPCYYNQCNRQPELQKYTQVVINYSFTASWRQLLHSSLWLCLLGCCLEGNSSGTKDIIKVAQCCILTSIPHYHFGDRGAVVMYIRMQTLLLYCHYRFTAFFDLYSTETCLHSIWWHLLTW